MPRTAGLASEGSIASFFKLILNPPYDLQILEIPKKFMNIHGGDLSSTIHLIIPTGKIWEFNLVKQNGKSLLRNGWPEFVQYYSISHGHCLMFQYRGDSRFDIVVFDASSSEIEYRPYSLKPRRDDIPTSSNEDVTDDNNLVIVGSRGGGQKLNHIEIDMLLSRDYEYPSFAVRMQPSYISVDGLMIVPREFVRKYMRGLEIPCNFTLHTTSHIWTVKLVSRMVLSAGWRSFAVDNKLEEGDICIFQLIGKQEFKIDIIPSSRV